MLRFEDTLLLFPSTDRFCCLSGWPAGSQCSMQALTLPFVVSGGLGNVEFSIIVYSFVVIIFVIFLKSFYDKN